MSAHAESVSPEWLAERAAIAEKRLRATPLADLGPAGRLLMAALTDGGAFIASGAKNPINARNDGEGGRGCDGSGAAR